MQCVPPPPAPHVLPLQNLWQSPPTRGLAYAVQSISPTPMMLYKYSTSCDQGEGSEEVAKLGPPWLH